VDAEVMSLAMHNLVQQVGQKLGTPVRGEFDAFGTGEGPVA
jgi:hypothetical protein